MARLFIRLDKEGQILAVANIEGLPEDQLSPYSDEPDVETVEIVDEKEKLKFVDMNPIDIHEGYIFDKRKKRLKKRRQ